jgi:hypothetical protein
MLRIGKAKTARAHRHQTMQVQVLVRFVLKNPEHDAMQLLVYGIPTMTPSSCIDRRSCYPNVFGMSGFIAWHCAFALEDGRNICRNPHVPLRIIGGIRLWQECAKGSWESGHVSSLRHVVSLCAILYPTLSLLPP